jgi:cysteine desulfuration protein SufE
VARPAATPGRRRPAPGLTAQAPVHFCIARAGLDLGALRAYIEVTPGHYRAPGARMTIDEIIDNFAVLDDWDDRYRYVIELGRELTPLPDAARTDANKVQGCASQVWLATSIKPNGKSGPVLTFAGDSDAHIVRGLIAILFAFYSGKAARDILAADAIALFNRLGLSEHLTPQRSNGFKSMVERIKTDARSALAVAA